MYNLIVFALCCFGVGIATGLLIAFSLLLKGVKSLTKRKTPKS